jgi:hypothetical protein
MNIEVSKETRKREEKKHTRELSHVCVSSPLLSSEDGDGGGSLSLLLCCLCRCRCCQGIETRLRLEALLSREDGGGSLLW